MMEDAGLALPVVCTDWLSPAQLQFQSIAPLDVAMEVLFKTGPSSSVGNMTFNIACCKTWKVDGAIITYPYSCRVYAISPLMIKKAIREELGIPVMALELDAYDTRQYSAGQLKARVEAFAELLRTAKATTAS